MSAARRVFILIAVAAAANVLGGCERAMQNMYDQPRYKPLRAAPDIPGGNSSLVPPDQSVVHAQGAFAEISSGRSGESAVQRDEAADTAPEMPYAMSAELIGRGRDRYDIYCQPCHSPVGDGDGRIVRRGFPQPPSYHIARLRDAPDRHFYDVMTNGHGIMYSYAERVSPPDRWAIVAYIRALQLSQHADVAQLPETVRARLPAEPSPVGPPTNTGRPQ